MISALFDSLVFGLFVAAEIIYFDTPVDIGTGRIMSLEY